MTTTPSITKYLKLPNAYRRPMKDYLEHGVRPFMPLIAMLQGDLRNAQNYIRPRSDAEEAADLHSTAFWIYQNCPEGSWGSTNAVEMWAHRQQLAAAKKPKTPALDYSELPEIFQYQMKRYIERGRRTSLVVMYVLSNQHILAHQDMRWDQGDEPSDCDLRELHDLIIWVADNCPMRCKGNSATYHEWVKSGGYEGSEDTILFDENDGRESSSD